MSIGSPPRDICCSCCRRYVLLGTASALVPDLRHDYVDNKDVAMRVTPQRESPPPSILLAFEKVGPSASGTVNRCRELIRSVKNKHNIPKPHPHPPQSKNSSRNSVPPPHQATISQKFTKMSQRWGAMPSIDLVAEELLDKSTRQLQARF